MADDENTEQTTKTFETRRVRTLTAPAQEEYERRVIKFTTDLRSIKNDLDAGVAHVDEVRNDPDYLKSVRELIQSCETAYRELSGKFLDYLRATRTYYSENEEASHHIIFRTVLYKVNLFMRRIDKLLNPPPASKGHHSARHSVKSNASYLEMKEAELRAAVVKKEVRRTKG